MLGNRFLEFVPCRRTVILTVDQVSYAVGDRNKNIKTVATSSAVNICQDVAYSYIRL